MITQDFIKSLKPWEIFASWVFENSPSSVYLTDDDKAKKKVRWVAVRWQVPDWAIYYEDLYQDKCIVFWVPGVVSIRYCEWTNENIAKVWYKLPTSFVRDVIDVNDNALAHYRWY